MKTKKITVELSMTDYEALSAIADASGWSLAEVLAQCVRSGMPPTLTKVPDAFHDELLALNGLDDRHLLDLVEGKRPSKSAQSDLHKKANFDALRRTYALSLLRWRGHPVPMPYEGLIG